MNNKTEKIVISTMQMREMPVWEKERTHRNSKGKTWKYLSVSVICLTIGALILSSTIQKNEGVLSVMSTGFEYDETLGRLQYVSSLLPDSAMVFLSHDVDNSTFYQPSVADTLHVWTQEEPWIEYQGGSQIIACKEGEIMSVIQNRDKEYTVRVLHQNGYESVYSGLSELDIDESSYVNAGDRIGYAKKRSAFELRRDGLSVLPVFSQAGGK